MIPDSVHIEAVERALRSIYASGDRLLCSFMYGRPGAQSWGRRLGTEIFVIEEDYIQTLLFIRQNGPSYLRSMSVTDLWKIFTDFLVENFWYISAGELSRKHDRSYAEQVDDNSKLKLAEQLAYSALFRPEFYLSLFPLDAVRIQGGFEYSRFFLISANELSVAHMPSGILSKDIDPDMFPPTVNWDRKKRQVSSWLGVRSPLIQISNKIRSIILGSVGLTMDPSERYLHTMRKVGGGECTFTKDNRLSVRWDTESHMPPVAYPRGSGSTKCGDKGRAKA